MPFLKKIFGKPKLDKLVEKRDVPGLIQALDHDDPRVRLEAVKAMAVFQGDEFIDPLIEVFKNSKDDSLRKEAARVLAQNPQEKVIRTLIDAIARAYSGINPLISTNKTRAYDGTLDEAVIEYLAWMGEAAIPYLIAAIGEKTSMALGKMGSLAVPALISALEKSRDVYTIAALGLTGHSSAVDPLLQVLADLNTPTEEKRVYWKMLHQDTGKDNSSFDKYKQLFSMYRVTIRALGEIGDERAVGPLLEIVQSRMDRDLRREAIVALTRMNSAQTYAVLSAIAADYEEVPEVRKAAVYALSHMEVPPDPGIMAAQAVSKRAWVEAVAQGSAAIEPLVDYIHTTANPKHTEVDKHKHWLDMAQALAGTSEPWTLIPFFAFAHHLQGDYTTARSYLMRTKQLALDTLNNHTETFETARHLLIDRLYETHPDVRLGAVWWLGEYKGPESTAIFSALLQDENARIRSNASYALEMFGDQSVIKPLMAYLVEHKSKSAASALKRIGLPDDADDLIKIRVAILTEDWSSATQLGEVAVDALVQHLTERYNIGKQHAVYQYSNGVGAAVALGQIGDPRAVEPICARLDELVHTVKGRWAAALDSYKGGLPYVPRTDDIYPQGEILVTALSNLADPRALPSLEAIGSYELIQDHLPELGEIAREAILKIKKIQK